VVPNSQSKELKMECRVCNSDQLELAIDLGQQPWCNHFLPADQVGKEPYYPLRVVHCQGCKTAQLDYTVKKEVMFGNHTYLSGVTKSLSDHFHRVALDVDDRFFKTTAGKSVLDIGSNDGTQLKHFKELGYEVLGVESSRTTAQIANDAGITTLNRFFNLEAAKDIGRKFHIINAAGVFFHLEELHSVAEGIRDLLRNDGVFVVQFLYMKRIVDNRAFDQIYHEHLLYYNLRTAEVLLQRHGMSMFDACLASIHGGSIIAFVTHSGREAPTARLEEMRAREDRDEANELRTYLRFADEIKRTKQDNLAYLSNAKHAGKHIFGMGAPVKGNTLLNYFGVGTQYIDCLVEKNELRRGLYSPGMHIPIAIEKELTMPPDIYYVLAWNFKKEILANNRHLLDQGVEFFFPVDPKDL
jgi:SAM-dependent methyltransferase